MKVSPIERVVKWKNWCRKQPANDPILMEPLKNPVLTEEAMMVLRADGRLLDVIV